MKKRNTITLIAVLILLAIAAYFMLSSGFLQSIFSSTSVESGHFGDIPDNTALQSGSSGKQIRVSFLDVAQGDSTFIEFPDKTCMLIDAGESEMSSRIIKYIKNRGYERIDYVLVTHPHADHIGGMPQVLNSFDIGRIYMTSAVTNTSLYSRLLDTIQSKGIKLTRAKKGVIIKSGEVEVELLSPVREEYDNLNNYSAVCKISFGNNSFLFMGDAEKLVENELEGDLTANVVKIGHHGSSTSSGAGFVMATHADYGILSLGEGNSFGHPNAAVVKIWEQYSVKLLRTDVLGNIVFIADGESITYYSENGGQGDTIINETEDDPDAENRYVLNEGSRKVHKFDCVYVKTISENNYALTSKTPDELKLQGYTLCSSCKPE